MPSYAVGSSDTEAAVGNEWSEEELDVPVFRAADADPEDEDLDMPGYAVASEDTEVATGKKPPKESLLGKFKNSSLKSLFSIKRRDPEKEQLPHSISQLGTVVVAIAGATNRVGTTHHAIQTALYLRKFGRVACCELAPPESAVFWTFNKDKGNPFRYKGVTFYPCCTNYLSLMFNKEFDFVVLDIGSIVKNNELNELVGEFARANQKILITGPSVWDCTRLIKAVEMLHIKNYLNGTQVVINISSDNVFQEIATTFDSKQREILGIQLHKGGVTSDLFNELDIELYEKLLI